MRFVVEEMDMARQMFSAREREIKMRSSELRRKIEARAVATREARQAMCVMSCASGCPLAASLAPGLGLEGGLGGGRVLEYPPEH